MTTFCTRGFPELFHMVSKIKTKVSAMDFNLKRSVKVKRKIIEYSILLYFQNPRQQFINDFFESIENPSDRFQTVLNIG